MLKPIPVNIFNKMADIHLRDLGPVIVEGEISQIQISQGKWLFMTIKDEIASVGVFGAIFNLPGANILEAGMKVHVYGQAGLYKKTGRFNINATKIVPAGEGALRLAFEKLKQKLEEEGLFDPARKRLIPRFPERIGLITAKDSRAYGDFVKILQARIGGIKIFFYPVNVQGENSADSILKAFQYFNSQKNLDAVVITRGGGSLEDLISFNDERVARAIFASKYPVISAIGHEDDVALTDYVADLRASTPSNASELLSPSRSEILSELNGLTMKMNRIIENQVWEWRQAVDHQVGILDGYFLKQKKYFGDLIKNISSALLVQKEKIHALQQKSNVLKGKILSFSDVKMNESRSKADSLGRLLQTFDYNLTLKRGFSLTKTTDGKLLTSVSNLQKNMEIETIFHDGKAKSKII